MDRFNTAVFLSKGPLNLGGYRIKWLDETKSLATGGAATTLTNTLPAGAMLLGFASKFTVAPADIDGDTATWTTTGTSSTIGTMSALTTAGHLEKAVATALTATTSFVLTLSGGSDNTPSAGEVRVRIYYVEIDALT